LTDQGPPGAHTVTEPDADASREHEQSPDGRGHRRRRWSGALVGWGPLLADPRGDSACLVDHRFAFSTWARAADWKNGNGTPLRLASSPRDGKRLSTSGRVPRRAAPDTTARGCSRYTGTARPRRQSGGGTTAEIHKARRSVLGWLLRRPRIPECGFRLRRIVLDCVDDSSAPERSWRPGSRSDVARDAERRAGSA
jgi:hypothetical protein